MKMKTVSLISAAGLLLMMSCSHNDKYDVKREEIEKQEAIEMVKDSNNIEIKKGWGDDKIILKDE